MQKRYYLQALHVQSVCIEVLAHSSAEALQKGAKLTPLDWHLVKNDVGVISGIKIIPSIDPELRTLETLPQDGKVYAVFPKNLDRTHVVIHDAQRGLVSACSMSIQVSIDALVPASQIPVAQRCKRPACLKRWPAAPV